MILGSMKLPSILFLLWWLIILAWLKMGQSIILVERILWECHEPMMVSWYIHFTNLTEGSELLYIFFIYKYFKFKYNFRFFNNYFNWLYQIIKQQLPLIYCNNNHQIFRIVVTKQYIKNITNYSISYLNQPKCITLKNEENAFSILFSSNQNV